VARKRAYHRARVVVRDGREVTVKFCRRCRRTKVVDEFWVNESLPDGTVRTYSALCGVCMAERSRRRAATKQRRRRHLKDLALRRARHAERMATDWEYVKRRRVVGRAAAVRWLAKPGNAERARLASVRYHRELRATRREEINEANRMYYHLRREREGKQRREGLPSVIDGTRPLVPNDPFRTWLDDYRTTHRLGVAELARVLRIEERRARSVLSGEQANVAVDVVERALTEALAANGSITRLDDLYDDEVIVAATVQINDRRGNRWS
jgi:hypothetical protein